MLSPLPQKKQSQSINRTQSESNLLTTKLSDTQDLRNAKFLFTIEENDLIEENLQNVRNLKLLCDAYKLEIATKYILHHKKNRQKSNIQSQETSILKLIETISNSPITQFSQTLFANCIDDLNLTPLFQNSSVKTIYKKLHNKSSMRFNNSDPLTLLSTINLILSRFQSYSVSDSFIIAPKIIDPEIPFYAKLLCKFSHDFWQNLEIRKIYDTMTIRIRSKLPIANLIFAFIKKKLKLVSDFSNFLREDGPVPFLICGWLNNYEKFQTSQKFSTLPNDHPDINDILHAIFASLSCFSLHTKIFFQSLQRAIQKLELDDLHSFCPVLIHQIIFFRWLIPLLKLSSQTAKYLTHEVFNNQSNFESKHYFHYIQFCKFRDSLCQGSNLISSPHTIH